MCLGFDKWECWLLLDVNLSHACFVSVLFVICVKLLSYFGRILCVYEFFMRCYCVYLFGAIVEHNMSCTYCKAIVFLYL